MPTYGITALAEIHAGIVVTSRGGYVAIESSWECGDKTYIVAIKGTRTGWLRNVRANPNVRLRIRGGTFSGTARELLDASQRQAAMDAYCKAVSAFEHLEYRMWRSGRPTRSKIEELHRTWFERDTPLIVDLTKEWT